MTNVILSYTISISAKSQSPWLRSSKWSFEEISFPLHFYLLSLKALALRQREEELSDTAKVGRSQHSEQETSLVYGVSCACGILWEFWPHQIQGKSAETTLPESYAICISDHTCGIEVFLNVGAEAACYDSNAEADTISGNLRNTSLGSQSGRFYANTISPA